MDPCNCIDKKDVDLTNTSQQCVSTSATNYKRVPFQILCNVWTKAPFQLTQELLTPTVSTSDQ